MYFTDSASDSEFSTPAASDPGSQSQSSPESIQSPDDSCYCLKAYIPDRRVTAPIKAFLTTLIASGSDGNSQVFRAEIDVVAHGRVLDNTRDVVCKVAYGERQIEALRKEADLYNTKLFKLQGIIVPLMYGCYVDDTDEGPTGVLVLQYCGVPLTYALRYYALTIRYQAVNALLAIHKAGVQHNDFVERNLVVSKDKKGAPYVRVVDFGLAGDHTCKVEVDTIRAYTLVPEGLDFHCDELYAVCLERADIWLPKYTLLFGDFIHVEHATSVDTLLQHAHVPEWASESYAREWAQKAIDMVAQIRARRKAMDANPLPIEFDTH